MGSEDISKLKYGDGSSPSPAQFRILASVVADQLQAVAHAREKTLGEREREQKKQIPTAIQLIGYEARSAIIFFSHNFFPEILLTYQPHREHFPLFCWHHLANPFRAALVVYRFVYLSVEVVLAKPPFVARVHLYLFANVTYCHDEGGLTRIVCARSLVALGALAAVVTLAFLSRVLSILPATTRSSP